MEQLTQPFRQTHSAPANGARTWSHPGSPENGPPLDPHLPVQVVRVYGEWAQVACSNGWSAWVDATALVPLGATKPAPMQFSPHATSSRAFAARISVPSLATWSTSAGALLVIVAAVLPWIDMDGLDAVAGVDVPAAFLVERDNLADGGPGVGALLVVLAVLAFALRHVRGAEKLARVPAGLCGVAAGAFLVQLDALLGVGASAGTQDAPSLWDVVGIGPAAAIVGSGLMSWGGRSR